MTIPTHPVIHCDGIALGLTDDPLNRGMVAALRELKSMALSQTTRRAYVWRITDTDQLYDHVDRLTNFLQQSSDGNVLTLSIPFVKALAVTSYDIDEYTASINIDDLLMHANRFRDEETRM